VFWKQCGLFQLWVSGRSLSKPFENDKASKRDDENSCMFIARALI